VVLSVDRDPGRLPNDPSIGQRLRPRRIDHKTRHGGATAHSRRLRGLRCGGRANADDGDEPQWTGIHESYKAPRAAQSQASKLVPVWPSRPDATSNERAIGEQQMVAQPVGSVGPPAAGFIDRRQLGTSNRSFDHGLPRADRVTLRAAAW
jgi:hypothetical protein